MQFILLFSVLVYLMNRLYLRLNAPNAIRVFIGHVVGFMALVVASAWLGAGVSWLQLGIFMLASMAIYATYAAFRFGIK